MEDNDYLKRLMQYYDSKKYASLHNMIGRFDGPGFDNRDADYQYEQYLPKLDMDLDMFEKAVHGRPSSQYAMNPAFKPKFIGPLPIGSFENYVPWTAFHSEDINARTHTFTIKNYSNDITNIITRIYYRGGFLDVIFIQSSQDKGMMLPFVHRDPQLDVSRNVILHRFINEYIDWTLKIEMSAYVSSAHVSSPHISSSTSMDVLTPNGIVSQVVSTLPDDSLLPMPNTKYGYMDINAINDIFDEIKKDSELGGYFTDAADSWI
jgi:hypothetical protein